MNYYVGMRFYHIQYIEDYGHVYEVVNMQRYCFEAGLLINNAVYDTRLYGYDTFKTENGWRVLVDMDAELDQL